MQAALRGVGSRHFPSVSSVIVPSFITITGFITASSTSALTRIEFPV
tara:strand:+ start:119 stop:259 length:141 start_codon:yes stop_codon:yes gene_type:complete